MHRLAPLLFLAGCPVAAPAGLVLTDVTAAPLSAQPSLLRVVWTQNVAARVHVVYAYDSGAWVRSPDRDLGAGEHEELLVGIPYGSTTSWQVVAVAAGATDPTPVQSPVVETTNGALPEGVPVARVEVAATGAADATPYVFTAIAPGDFGGPWWRLILDRAGRVVWANPSAPERSSLAAKVALDGRSLYLDQNSFWSLFDAGAASTVEQTLLDGSILHEFLTPGLHHPFTDLPDGGVAYGAVQGFYADEILTEVGRDGEAVERWGCQDFLEGIGAVERCGSNAISYDAATGHLLYSFYSFESVVEIQAATGDTVRWFGHLPGSYTFHPPESAFWWQHGVSYTDTGTLLLSCDRSDAGEETIVREYTVDAASETLHEVWRAGEGGGLYGEQMGEAVRLPGGNTWHNDGRLPRLQEFTPDGAVVWDLAWDATAIGRTLPIQDLWALLPERR